MNIKIYLSNVTKVLLCSLVMSEDWGRVVRGELSSGVGGKGGLSGYPFLPPGWDTTPLQGYSQH